MSRRKTNPIADDLLIERDPDVMSGVPVFAGTRVPVQALIDDLVAGDSLSEFEEAYPGVGADTAREFLIRIGAMIEAGVLDV